MRLRVALAFALRLAQVAHTSVPTYQLPSALHRVLQRVNASALKAMHQTGRANGVGHPYHALCVAPLRGGFTGVGFEPSLYGGSFFLTIVVSPFFVYGATPLWVGYPPCALLLAPFFDCGVNYAHSASINSKPLVVTTHTRCGLPADDMRSVPVGMMNPACRRSLQRLQGDRAVVTSPAATAASSSVSGPRRTYSASRR
jgi:hypothetical protein